MAELLALSVAPARARWCAGAGHRVGAGLAGELPRALADARAGASVVTALSGIAERTSVPALTRFVDGVVVALQRGTRWPTCCGPRPATSASSAAR